MTEHTVQQIALITDGPEGVSRTPYTSVEPSPGDRDVRQRHVANRGADTITEFAATAERPSTYPTWLPFVRSRPVFTTESVPGGMSPGARWPCESMDDALAVLAVVERASEDEGWTAAPSLQMPGHDDAIDTTYQRVLVRNEQARVLDATDAGSAFVVSLLEIPSVILQQA